MSNSTAEAVASNSDLFDPVTLGPYTLPNRIVMAPLTRSRATPDGVPVPMMAEYYGQRATAGLIISEATNITMQGRGYAFTPGLYTDEQVAGWKMVTDTIHAKGGRIFAQLWHVGRVSHPSLQPGGALPVAPSAIMPNVKAFPEEGFEPAVTPRALETDEIPGLIEDYRKATRNAFAAGFDGVEVHAANGYLIEQFLRDSTNKRTDAYGGSQENRVRLLLEVTKAVVEIAGSERTGVRLSPLTPANDMPPDSDPLVTYSLAVDGLNAFNLAYLHVIEGATRGARELEGGFDMQVLRRKFNGLYIANNGYNLDLALEARRKNFADLIAFGRPFIANPDLVRRLRIGAPLNEADSATFYGGGAEGYVDYPSLD